MGVGNDPIYNNTRCFLTFAFPDADEAARTRIGAAAEKPVKARRAAQARSPKATLTAIYNLIDAVRSGAPLSDAEQKLHALVATDNLIRLHDELDRAVLNAYGWPHTLSEAELIQRLVALNHARAATEARCEVLWLRPDRVEQVGALAPQQAILPQKVETKSQPWPSDKVDQVMDVLSVVRAADAAMDMEAVAAAFVRAPRKRVEDILERRVARRLILEDDAGRYRVIPTN